MMTGVVNVNGEAIVRIVVGDLDKQRVVVERPATEFVANFVGVSNWVDGKLAHRLTGIAQSFMVRPEKIRISAPDTDVSEGMCGVAGQIETMEYLGMYTRYEVGLQPEEFLPKAFLTVVEQNRQTSCFALGESVQLLWQREHMVMF